MDWGHIMKVGCVLLFCVILCTWVEAQETPSLAQQTGFEHPIWAELEAQELNEINGTVDFNVEAITYRLVTVRNYYGVQGRGLLFRMDTAPTLLGVLRNEIGIFVMPADSGFHAPPPSDWNDDGLL